MIVYILGTPYTVSIANEKDEPRLEGCDGFCDETTREIFALRRTIKAMPTSPIQKKTSLYKRRRFYGMRSSTLSCLKAALRKIAIGHKTKK